MAAIETDNNLDLFYLFDASPNDMNGGAIETNNSLILF